MSLLCWIDIETTGLDPASDKILEVAMVITNFELNMLLQYHAVIARPVVDFELMDEVVCDMHTKSGLWDEVLKSKMSLEDVECTLCQLLKDYDKPVLAGSSVHFDRMFLRRHMSSLHKRLHYRNLDVSTVKMLAQNWYPDFKVPEKKDAHRALPDILESIELLKILRAEVFK